VLTKSLYYHVTLKLIRIRQLCSFNIRRMSNMVKLFEIRQRSNLNFVTSLHVGYNVSDWTSTENRQAFHPIKRSRMDRWYV